MILINTTKQNVWLWQPLLAAELYNAEYHPVEHQADTEVKGGVVNTIKVQVEQMESTPTDMSTPNLGEEAKLTCIQQCQFIDLIYDHPEVFSLHDEDLGFCDQIEHTIPMTMDKPVYLAHHTTPPQLQWEVHKCLGTRL